jgi:2'-5' RNA ligase
MIRLFVAVDLPEAVRQRLALVRAPLPDARWIPPENMHLTLRFIGEVPPPLATEIDTLLGRIEAPPFELRLGRLGTFGSRGRVRILWAGIDGGEALAHLQAKIERACMRAGLPPDPRKFHPHVTLARCKDVREALASEFIGTHDGFDVPAIPVDRFVLYSSHTGRAGAIYSQEAVYPLTH